ncbi:MAG: helix-turn-helix domain-containing protein [Lachnospiraceae bacterium]|nr:helix-turn-helix domain-containing protein [Lachnospiraceae bacterium]MDE6619988.1 helix-turn-helix domain-containing protein [Lachnospiraceae bacterium]
MSFGQNLQCLRKMRNKMTQEELAEKLNVSRQTVSKWELDIVYPEMEKVVELCTMFSCTMDELVRGDFNLNEDAYSDIRTETVKAFDYIKYAVFSREPESDAINHVKRWAEELGMTEPVIIGWNFPFLSQEQVNVFHMHGYEAALIVQNDMAVNVEEKPEVIHQEEQTYAAITIRNPGGEPFRIIPNAYEVLMTHMKINGMQHKQDKKVIECFEKEYVKDGIGYMDIYIAVA